MTLTSASTRTKGLVMAPVVLATLAALGGQLPADAAETAPDSLVNGDFTQGRLGWEAGSTGSQLSIVRVGGDQAAALSARPGTTEASLSSRPSAVTSTGAGHRVTATAWVRSSARRQGGELTLRSVTTAGKTRLVPQPFTASRTWQRVSVTTTTTQGKASLDVLVSSSLPQGQRLLVDRVSLTGLETTSATQKIATPVLARETDLVGSPITSSTLTSLGWVAKEEGRVGAITSLPSASGLGDSTGISGTIMRSEVRPGETFTGGDGHTAPRSEVYGRIPTNRALPASAWADPPGSERWYDFNVFIPTGFPVATDTRWFTFTQWKGLNGGSPPVALEIKRSNIRLGGTRTNAGLVPGDGALGPIAFGQWTRLTVGIKFSTDATQGWVQVYRNGVAAMPRTPLATMDVVNGNADPTYLKQGIYRSAAWTSTQALYFSPMQVTNAQPAGLS